MQIFIAEYNDRAGLVDLDTHMRDPKAGSDFKFLEDIKSSISAVYNFFNLGQEFHHFMEVAKELAAGGTDISVKLPRFFSTTRYILVNLCH